ncbi:MAG: L-lactate permease, partial [Planctomycetota bacterium]|nr:L-lactate permease [Planctomycetota bacterium]
LVGIGTGLGADPQVLAHAQSLGFESADGELPSSYLTAIGLKVAFLHTVLGAMVPLLVATLMTRFFGENRSAKEGLAIWKFSLFAAFSMTIPYFLSAYFLGPEFPSLIGGLVGLAVVTIAAQNNFLMPKENWDFPPNSQWEPDWMAPESKPLSTLAPISTNHRLTTFNAWLPYLLVAFFLVITRVPQLGLQALFKSVAFEASNLYQSGIDIKITPLYLPSTLFILVSLITFIFHRVNPGHYFQAWKRSAFTTASASVALLYTVPMVQIFIHTNHGLAGYPQMPIALADGASQLAAGAWPLISPIVGGLGAFVAGSNTVSNMMFSLFQFSTAQDLSINPDWVVALQAVGGAAGNTICVHNVVAASAVAGLYGKEGVIIRKTFIVFAYYAGGAGLIGLTIAMLI